MAISKILNAIYDNSFVEDSYGFRPGRGCHDALKKQDCIIQYKKVNYVIYADIKGFFNNVSHKWILQFLEHRIADRNLIRLIVRFLKVGAIEEGKFEPTEKGISQGGVVSPILANIYLHYVLDLWFEKAVKRNCKGEAYQVRYADDYICCFQYQQDAEACYKALKERLGKFELELAEDKS